MLNIIINSILSLLCAVCKWDGELYWHDAQRFIMPLVMAFGVSFNSHIWWLGIVVPLNIADLVEGYGVNSWMRKLLGDAGAQGMWMFGAAFLSGIILCFLHHLPWLFFIPWCIVCGIIGATLRKTDNEIVAPFKGLLLSLFIWFIH